MRRLRPLSEAECYARCYLGWEPTVTLVRLDEGTEVRVPGEALNGRTGRVAVGVRPEKIRLGHAEVSRRSGTTMSCTSYRPGASRRP